MFPTHICTSLAHFCSHTRSPTLSCWTDCSWSPISTQFMWIAWWADLGACILNMRVSPVWVWNFFKKSNLNLVYLWWSYGCCVNNVLINLVNFSKCLDFETLLRKSCSLNSESKRQVICCCENLASVERLRFQSKFYLIAKYLGQLNFRSRGGCCDRLISVCCAYFWNKNSFPRSCSWKVQTLEPRRNWDIYGTTTRLVLVVVWSGTHGSCKDAKTAHLLFCAQSAKYALHCVQYAIKLHWTEPPMR